MSCLQKYEINTDIARKLISVALKKRKTPTNKWKHL